MNPTGLLSSRCKHGSWSTRDISEAVDQFCTDLGSLQDMLHPEDSGHSVRWPYTVDIPHSVWIRCST